MVSQIGIGGTDVIGDEEMLGRIDVDPLEFEIDGQVLNGTGIAVGAAVSGLTFSMEGGENVLVTGKKVSDSNFTFKDAETSIPIAGSKVGDESLLALQNKKNDNVDIKAEDKIALDVRIDSKFTNSSVDSGAKKDKVEITGDALKKSSFDLGKGKDTFRIKGTKIKGTNTVDLGKGKDKLVIGEGVTAAKKGKLFIENMGKKDSVKVGGETFTKKDIKNGDAPGFIELG